MYDIIRYSPLFDLSFVDDFFNQTNKSVWPKESDKQFIYAVDLKGFNKEDIKVAIKENTLTVEAKHTDSNTKRSCVYSTSIDKDKLNVSTATCNLKNGVLTVVIDKVESKEEPVQIEVKT